MSSKGPAQTTSSRPPSEPVAVMGDAHAGPARCRRPSGLVFGVLWEFGLRTRGVTPSLNDYAHMRQHSAGGVGALSWTEIIDGAEIPGVCGRPHRAAP